MHKCFVDDFLGHKVVIAIGKALLKLETAVQGVISSGSGCLFSRPRNSTSIKGKQKSWFWTYAPMRVTKTEPFATTIKNITPVVH